MSRTTRFAVVALSLWPLLTLAPGCAGLAPKLPLKNTGPTTLQERKREVSRQLDENRDFAEYQAAVASWEQDNLKACEETVKHLLERNPEHCDARLLMIDVCLAGNRVDEALDHAKRALRSHPNDPQVQYAMGLLLDVTNQKGEALAYYERAVKWEPDNEVYAVGYQTALRAVRQPGAAEAKGPELHKVPDTPPLPVAVDRAGASETAGKDSPEDLLQQGCAALDLDAPAAALDYFREAAALAPHNPQILILAATAALRHNQPDLAIELIRPAEKRFANSAPLKRILGLAYYRQGDYRSSQVALQQALSLDKSSALAYFLMGCTLVKLGQLESADAHFRQAQTIDARYTVRR